MTHTLYHYYTVGQTYYGTTCRASYSIDDNATQRHPIFESLWKDVAIVSSHDWFDAS